MSTKRSQPPIAVVGVSALFPGSTDSRGFWNDILAGKDLITDVPASHWLIEDYYDPNPKALDKTYSKRGGFMPKVDFDPMEFGVPPSIVPATDSAQILALIVAQKVLDDAAQGQFSKMDRERISVLLGVTSAQELLGSMVSRLQKPVWLKALREAGVPETEAQDICLRIANQYTPWQESSFPGLLGNVVAGRIANRFDLRGTNAVTDAACASSLAAVSMGINELQLGQSDLVITGGVDAMNDIFMYLCFSKTPALSPTGDCRPFSDAADGTLLGEGMAMLALKRLDDAERDGDRVYAVIKGLGSASDGRANSVYAPLPEGQARSLRRAYEVAGYGPETVELVEAHGTGTKAGDAAEFAGLKLAFGGASPEKQWCALGTVKSQIGHTKAAAGAAGLFKAVMALHHKVLPPTIKVERPNPKLEIEQSPFYLNTQRRPWIRDGQHPRRASVSSFGFGGSNFHVTLEEYLPQGKGQEAWRLRAVPTELVLLGAATPAELVSKARALATSQKELSVLARETQLSFKSQDGARLAVQAATLAELGEKLTQAAATIEKSPNTGYSTPAGVHYATGAADAGQVAFLFPGQGSQYVGMGAEAAMAFDLARKAWDEAANLPFGTERLQDVVFPRPVFTDADREAQQKKLTQTEWAQPALGVHSQSLANVLHAIGVRPSCVGGHSFGEVSALHEAGVLDAAALVKVARKRGELMRDASAVPGAMTAVARPIDEVKAAVAESGAKVVVANHNSPAQVVLSGSVEEIARVEAALASKGMTAKRLPVATAFHSPLVAGSSAPFKRFLDGVTVTAPSMDVFANATAAPYGKDPAAIREQLASQLAQPVRFVDQIEAMYARGVRTFVEVGAGSVLTELVGRILGDRPHRAINLDRKGKHGVTTLQDGLGRLAVAGVQLDLAPLWAPFAPPSEKPVKKPAMTMPITGANSGRPYPPPGGAKDLPPPNPPRAVAERVVEVERIVEVEKIVERPVSRAGEATITVTQQVAAPEAHQAWVHAFQESQRQTADAHAAYQRAMAESHLAFLNASQSSFAGLSSMLSLSPEGERVGVRGVAAAPQPMLQQTYAPPAPVAAAPVAAMPAAVAPAAVAPVAVAPVAVAAPASAALDLESLMMTIVAEKTGYPKEMLGAQMELEADLGIDSIKRVEILSAMRERAPNLPEVKPTELATLRTLGQIVDHMKKAMPAASASLSPSGERAGVREIAPPAPIAAGPAVDLEALMMTIVAEKTGYPKEMLGAHMELEADLGIDSIKRVEILSAMRERAPNLPEVKPTELATLRTLGQIVDHMKKAMPAASASLSPSGERAGVREIAPAAPIAAAPAVDLEALMMTIVAEKTGYPREMLGAHMELEADLGIDSIKRVEILSAMRERAPNLPEVKPTELATLRTLGQIVDHMKKALPPSATAPVAAPAAAVPTSAAPAIDLEALMMTIVAEKTGYPREMLGAHMELEADLGIDSIKRVEILSAMRERAPNLPEVKPTELATLRTLGQIVDHMRQATPGASPLTPTLSPVGERESSTPDTVERFAVREVPAAPVGMALAGILGAQKLCITDDGTGVAQALVTQLAARGVKATVVTQAPADADALIFLGGLRAVKTIDEAVAVNREAFHATRTIAARFQEHGGTLVTVQDTGGDFGLSGKDATRAYLGGVSALARTAALEWNKAHVKAIDLARGGRDATALAQALTAELLGGGTTLEVGLHADGRRTTLQSVKTPSPTTPAVELSPRSVLIASGGGRGVTAAGLIALAKARQPRIVLLGRTALGAEPAELKGIADEPGLKRALLQKAQAEGKKPTPAELNGQLSALQALREIRGTLAALKAAGSEARYLAVDVANAAALSAALDTVRAEWGPITGVVHGAGVLADKRIAEKTDEQFDRVFDTKVKGLRALLSATAKDPLTSLCFFSSIAARTGNLGQCDYAMANEVLNLVACAERARRGPGCAVRAIGWGPWEGGMVTPSLKAHFQSMGVALIPLDVGARRFVDELGGASDDVNVVVGGAQGDGALGAKVIPQAVVEVRVDAHSHPHLADHSIAGVPVVPMVLAVEWFLRAARACRPDLVLAAVKQVKVLRGIKLDGYASGGDRFVVSARQLSNGSGAEVGVELRGKGDVLHYSATVKMTAGAVAQPDIDAPPVLEKWSGAAVYDGHVLFHGPRFQVIDSVKGVSREGIVGTLSGTQKSAWPAESWRSDAAAMDGGLQLALLWSRHVLGGAVLPMAMGEYRSYRDGLTEGPVQGVVHGRKIHDQRTVCDIAFSDASGQVVAEIIGVETVLRPGEPTTPTALA